MSEPIHSVGAYALVESVGGPAMEREQYGSLLLYKSPYVDEYKDIANCKTVVVAPPRQVRSDGLLQRLRVGEWDPAREPALYPGDTVYVHYLALQPPDIERQPMGERLTRFTHGGRQLFSVPYERLVAVERDGRLIPLNGLVLGEPVKVVVRYDRYDAEVEQLPHRVWRIVALSPAATLRVDGRPLQVGDVVIVPPQMAMVMNFHGVGETVRRYAAIGVEDVLCVWEDAKVDNEGRIVIMH